MSTVEKDYFVNDLFRDREMKGILQEGEGKVTITAHSTHIQNTTYSPVL